MWFKNIYLFQFEKKIAYDPLQFENELNALRFQPCAKSLPVSFGWVPPMGGDEAPLVHAENGCMMCCMQVEEKLLPPAVLRQAHAERVAEIESRQERALYRDEKLRLKDELYHTLLARAFSKYYKVFAYVDTQTGYFILDTTSHARIERFLGLFTKSVEHAIFVPETLSLAAMMTRWLKAGAFPAGLTSAHHCVLQSASNELSTVRLTHHDLLSDAVQKLVQQDAQVIQMTFTWRDQLQFTLKNNLSISNLKFLEGIQQAKDSGISETDEERFAADFAIMSPVLRTFVGELMGALQEHPSAPLKVEEALASSVV